MHRCLWLRFRNGSSTFSCQYRGKLLIQPAIRCEGGEEGEVVGERLCRRERVERETGTKGEEKRRR